MYDRQSTFAGSEIGYDDTGTAARFFHQSDWSAEIAERLATCEPVRYQAKAGRRERDAGLEGLPLQAVPMIKNSANNVDARPGRNEHVQPQAQAHNSHPTVKPIALARWLATLLLPPAAYAPRRLLVPFSGSGSECIGAMQAGWEQITGIEQDAEYNATARLRLAYWQAQPALELAYSSEKQLDGQPQQATLL